MSDDTKVVAPETDSAVPDLGPEAPGDGTAVDTESAEWKKRFNGLMASHQKALDALAKERDRATSAEAQLKKGPKKMAKGDKVKRSNDGATLTEIQALRAELQESRLAEAKADALRQFPDAAPFADLIVGRNPSEVLAYTRALAERASTLRAPNNIETDDTIEPTPVVTPTPTVIPGSISAPITAGGTGSPGVPTTAADAYQEALRIAHERPGSQDAWDAFLASRFTEDASLGLA